MTMKVKDALAFYSNCNEHYYYTDKLVKDFRQKNGEYIIFAKKTDVSTDKAVGEPNQKWHFITAYCEEKILENSDFLDQEMSQIYSTLKCPELCLWLIEATGLEVENLFDEIWIILKNGQNDGISRREAYTRIKSTYPWEVIEKKMKSLQE